MTTLYRVLLLTSEIFQKTRLIWNQGWHGYKNRL